MKTLITAAVVAVAGSMASASDWYNTYFFNGDNWEAHHTAEFKSVVDPRAPSDPGDIVIQLTSNVYWDTNGDDRMDTHYRVTQDVIYRFTDEDSVELHYHTDEDKPQRLAFIAIAEDLADDFRWHYAATLSVPAIETQLDILTGGRGDEAIDRVVRHITGNANLHPDHLNHGSMVGTIIAVAEDMYGLHWDGRHWVYIGRHGDRGELRHIYSRRDGLITDTPFDGVFPRDLPVDYTFRYNKFRDSNLTEYNPYYYGH